MTEQGEWLLRTHVCATPMKAVGRPGGERGDLWRCGCGQHWMVVQDRSYPDWHPISVEDAAEVLRLANIN